MKTATITELKKELKHRSPEQLVELCLTLSKHKKETKELLTYHLYEAENEENFIQEVKKEMDEQFASITSYNIYLVKKSVRKILRIIKKYIRFSKKKETEVELLLYFCQSLKNFKPSIKGSVMLVNIFEKQLELAEKATLKLHEDLQYDYQSEIEKLS